MSTDKLFLLPESFYTFKKYEKAAKILQKKGVLKLLGHTLNKMVSMGVGKYQYINKYYFNL